MADAGARSGVGIEVVGARELRRTLRGMTAELRDLSALNREVAEIVRGAMAATAPRDSGELAGRLRASGTRTKARVVSPTYYAPWVHYGTKDGRIAANRFGDRARAAQWGRVESTYRAGIARIVDKAAR